MRPIAKPILSVAAILTATALTACLVLNAFLALPATRGKIQREIGTAVGIPVTFGSVIGLPYPLGAIRIGGIKAERQGEITSFTAASITIRPELSELLRGKLVLAALDLKAPSLRLSIAPSAGESPTASGEGFTNAISSVTPPPATPGTPQRNLKKLPFPFSLESTASSKVTRPLSLRNIRISGADFAYLDGKGRPIVTFKGLSLVGSLHERNGISSWTGSLQAKSAAIGPALIVRNLQAPFSAPGNLTTMELSPFTASFGGGVLSGKITLSSLRQLPRYSLSLNLSNARFEKVLADASFGSSSAGGMITGDISLEGTAGNGSTINGKGSLLCREVVVEPVAFLKQIGQILGIDELKLLRLAEGKCLFRVDQGRFVIDDLLLNSENLTLAASGPMDSTGELHLDSRLLFNDKLAGRLRGLLGNKLTPAPESGYSQITFRVTGPALNPRTDLLERLTGIRIGGDLGGLGGLIKGLLGAPKPQPQPPAPQPTP